MWHMLMALWDNALTLFACWIIEKVRRFVWGLIQFAYFLWRANSRVRCLVAMEFHIVMLRTFTRIVNDGALEGKQLEWVRSFVDRRQARMRAWIEQVKDQPFELRKLMAR